MAGCGDEAHVLFDRFTGDGFYLFFPVFYAIDLI